MRRHSTRSRFLSTCDYDQDWQTTITGDYEKFPLTLSLSISRQIIRQFTRLLFIVQNANKTIPRKEKSNRAFEKFSNCRGSQKKKILKGLAVIVDKIKAPRRCSRILKFVPLLFFPTMRYNVRCSQARSLSSAFTATCSRG